MYQILFEGPPKLVNQGLLIQVWVCSYLVVCVCGQYKNGHELMFAPFGQTHVPFNTAKLEVG